LLVAQLNAVFPTDPLVGAPLIASASFRPANISSLVVGTALGGAFNHDFGLGSGSLQTYALQAVPEPSRALLAMLGLFGLSLRRRRN
jgi:hypothetical protein